jgi:hypothetical protein
MTVALIALVVGIICLAIRLAAWLRDAPKRRAAEDAWADEEIAWFRSHAAYGLHGDEQDGDGS